MKKNLINIISIILAIAVFYFLGREFLLYSNQIKSFSFKFDIQYLAIASILYVACFVIFSLGWNLILRLLHHPISFSHVLLYFFITQPSKYIPGKIWLAVTRMKFCKSHGISNSITFLSTGIEGVLEILAGSYISIIALLQMENSSKFSLIGTIAVIAVGLLLLFPRIFYTFINIYLKIAKREQIAEEKRVSFRQLLYLQIIYMLGMASLGISQMFFLRALMQFEAKYIPLVISIGAFSTVASIIAFFAPGGLGVREGIWYLALKEIAAPGTAMIFALVSRLWMIVIEALLLFIALPLLLFRRHKCEDPFID